MGNLQNTVGGQLFHHFASIGVCHVLTDIELCTERANDDIQ